MHSGKKAHVCLLVFLMTRCFDLLGHNIYSMQDASPLLPQLSLEQ
jgi:hypothetical protein